MPGHVQVFFDSGAGFREVASSNAWFETAPGAHEYRLRLPAGMYRKFRLDPGTLPGRYAIERVAVLAPDGSIDSEIPLAALEPAYQVTVVEKSDRRPSSRPAGHERPAVALFTRRTCRHPQSSVTSRSLRTAAIVGPGVARRGCDHLAWRWAIARRASAGDRILIRLGTFCAARPTAAIVAVAAVATIVSMDPVLLGRSFVAPTNGYLRLFYDSVPFTPALTTSE